jgi:hypothetical protein
VHLGNILELADVLAITQSSACTEVVQQREYIQRAYTEFRTLFSRQYRLQVNGEKLDPMEHLFNPSIIRIAVTLVKHKEHVAMLDGAFTSSKLRKALFNHFKAYRGPLLRLLQQELQDADQDYFSTYEWTGPPFTVVRADDLVFGEQSARTTARISPEFAADRSRKRALPKGEYFTTHWNLSLV